MRRYYWSDTLEPILSEGVEAEEDIQQLGRKLAKLVAEVGAMPLVEMEEFVAGLLALLDTVPTVDWLAQVWETETACADIEKAAELEVALRGRHNGVARTLSEDPRQYRPLLEVDERDGSVVWKQWIAPRTFRMSK